MCEWSIYLYVKITDMFKDTGIVQFEYHQYYHYHKIRQKELLKQILFPFKKHLRENTIFRIYGSSYSKKLLIGVVILSSSLHPKFNFLKSSGSAIQVLGRWVCGWNRLIFISTL